MATIDRIEPAFAPRSASTSGVTVTRDASVTVTKDAKYVGRHRRQADRVFSWRRLLYSARHRRR